MTQDEINLTIAEYKDAIKELKVYIRDEPDQAKCDQATKKIKAYRDKIEDLAWAAIISRTETLEGLSADLKAITDNASNVPQVSDAVKKLREASDKAATLAGGKGLDCKICGVKVVYLPNVLAAVVAVGGKKKLTLTCKNGHTAEYEIAAG